MNRYIIISPVRDEEKNIEESIQSVINQTIKPLKWIIVNDGSMDKTEEIIGKYLLKYNWISLINKKDRGYYQLGVGPCEAFYTGFNTINIKIWDYLVKLDADLSFCPNYFEILLERFKENPNLGIASGKTFIKKGGKLICELCPDDNVRGQIKMYRKACWQSIGGIETRRLWDAIDEIKAQKEGWETRSFYDLKVLHQRPIDARQKKPLRSKYIVGQNLYNIGYHPLFIIVLSLKATMLERPKLGGIAMFLGYVISLVNREEIYDYDLARFIRKKQISRFNIKHLFEYFSKR